MSCHRPDGTIWMVSLWYRYHDGAFECSTCTTADVVGYLREDPAVAFEVSDNQPPYRGVRGNGVADLSADPEKTVLRDLFDRYLGGTDSDLADWLLSEDRDEVRVRIDPEQVYSWDYSDRMPDGED